MYDVENNFNPHILNDDQQAVMNCLRDCYKSLAEFIVTHLPDNRERAVALTKLEDSSFWANAGIARTGKIVNRKVKQTVELKYLQVLKEIPEIPMEDAILYAKVFAYRQRRSWTIPISTYRRCKHLLLCKASLGRPSPYYTDLLKILSKDDLKVVLLDLYRTVKINKGDEL